MIIGNWQKSRVLGPQQRSNEARLLRRARKPSGTTPASRSRPLGAWLHQFFNERAGHIGRHPRVALDKRSFIQYRLGPVQRRNVGALEEFSDGNLIAPEQRFLHRGRPISRVIRGVVLELFHARTEPLISIVVIVGDTRAENVQERKPRMLNSLLDQLSKMFLLGAVSTRHEGGARG